MGNAERQGRTASASAHLEPGNSRSVRSTGRRLFLLGYFRIGFVDCSVALAYMLITQVSDIRSCMNVTQPYCSVSSTLRYVPIVLSPQCYSLLLVILTILSYACLVSMQDYLDEAMVHGRSNLSHPMVSFSGSILVSVYLFGRSEF